MPSSFAQHDIPNLSKSDSFRNLTSLISLYCSHDNETEICTSALSAWDSIVKKIYLQDYEQVLPCQQFFIPEILVGLQVH